MLKREESRYFQLTVLLLPLVAVGCGPSLLGVLPDSTDSLTSALTQPADDWTSGNPDAAAAVPSDDCLALSEPSDEMHKAVFDALNNFRVANGLSPLVYSRRLEAAADAHVRDMYERGFFAHINPDGENPGQRAVDAGFCHEYVGENLAAGQKTVEAAQQAWENSPSHHDNMMEPQYYYGGVGIYQAPSGRMYWAQGMAYKLN